METLKAMQAQIEKNGQDLFVGYHSHSNEVIPIEAISMNVMDALYAEFGDSVPLELDIAWRRGPTAVWTVICPTSRCAAKAWRNTL